MRMLTYFMRKRNINGNGARDMEAVNLRVPHSPAFPFLSCDSLLFPPLRSKTLSPSPALPSRPRHRKLRSCLLKQRFFYPLSAYLMTMWGLTGVDEGSTSSH